MVTIIDIRQCMKASNKTNYILVKNVWYSSEEIRLIIPLINMSYWG